MMLPQESFASIHSESPDTAASIVVGANRTQHYLPLLKGKRIGIVANQTSVIFKHSKTNETSASYTHLVDSLLLLGIDVKKIFAPEHGFRGRADAGEHLKNGIDAKTQLPVISLYGKQKKPSQSALNNLDLIIFDIQDVGVRFYTYISSLHYVMEACAERGIPLLVLDRPNPNAHYIDGPILEPENKSFVGMHPVPIVYGMTIGEYAQMINGESWLDAEQQCLLTVIPIEKYSHEMRYSLPIKPSPNLPNDKAINLYPSLCFFEGTTVSVGRGTDLQFQIFGSPFLDKTHFRYTFTPVSNLGAKHPKYENKRCFGNDLRTTKRLSHLNLKWLISAYQNRHGSKAFFNAFFAKLAGTKTLQKQIAQGASIKVIRASWNTGLETFKRKRKHYLLYD